MSNHCPLCSFQEKETYFEDNRSYFQCGNCQLVFVPRGQHLSSQEEKEIYDLHENSLEDLGYRNFLSRLASPLLQILKPQSKGLDFGCGPGPALSEMIKEQGHTVLLYDKYYAPDETVLETSFDFITATEVIEHLSHPGEVIEKLLGLLKPGGVLGIMTKLVKDQEAFSTWHYKNDQTHISFFSVETFKWVQKKWNLDLEIIGNDVIILSKRS